MSGSPTDSAGTELRGDAPFRFVQLVVPPPPPLPAGRYLVRYEERSHRAVVVVGGPPQRPRRRRLFRRARRPRAIATPPPLTLTVVAPEPLADRAAAERWLGEVLRSPEGALEWALRETNELFARARQARADSWPPDLLRPDILSVRVGFGSGEQVAVGAWTRARELVRAGAPGSALDAADALLAELLAARRRRSPALELALAARVQVASARLIEATWMLEAAAEEAAREGVAQRFAEGIAHGTAEGVAEGAAEAVADSAQLASLARSIRERLASAPAAPEDGAAEAAERLARAVDQLIGVLRPGPANTS